MAKPWGETPIGITEFSLMKEKPGGGWEALMVPMPGGAESTRVAIELLSEGFVAQYGGGTYKLRWLKRVGSTTKAGGYSPVFKMSGASRATAGVSVDEDAPSAATSGPVDVTTVLMAQLNRESERFEQRLQEERHRAETERARERDHYERLEAARMQGRIEVLEQLKTLHQISPPPPPAPPVSDAPPAWAAAIITRLDALEASFTDEEEEGEEEEEEESEEGETGITLAEAAKLSPMQEYLMNKAEQFGPLFISWLEKNAPPGTIPASVAQSVGASSASVHAAGAPSNATRQSVPPSPGVIDTSGAAS